MSKSSVSQSKIHPELVKWKYFYLDQKSKEIRFCKDQSQIPLFIRTRPKSLTY